MARLYDRLAAETRMPPGMDDAVVVRADNVVDYFCANHRGRFSYDWTPNAALPLSPLFVESRRPDRLVAPGWDGPSLFGAFMESHPRSELEKEWPNKPDAAWVDREWEWLNHTAVYGWTRAHGLYPRVHQFLVPVYADGRIALEDSEGLITARTRADRDGVNAAQQALVMLLMAISFMHCRNVETRDVTPPAPLSKKWEKKHGRPQVTYKVLDIDPMKKTLESEGRASQTGLKKALHICRGHFATYTEDAPLFGHYVGTVWKPQHVRGSAAEGAVVKDYNVKAPT